MLGLTRASVAAPGHWSEQAFSTLLASLEMISIPAGATNVRIGRHHDDAHWPSLARHPAVEPSSSGVSWYVGIGSWPSKPVRVLTWKWSESVPVIPENPCYNLRASRSSVQRRPGRDRVTLCRDRFRRLVAIGPAKARGEAFLPQVSNFGQASMIIDQSTGTR